jgi:pilus assembly protein CpaB
MKPKTLVLMGVAIVCGLGASYMTSRLLAERNSDDEPRVTVLVAKKSLNIGDTVKVPEEQFVEKKFVRGDEPPGAIDNIDLLKNRVLKRPLRAGDHVTLEDLISPTDGEMMSIVLPNGYRAIGVRVNIESGASGFACLPLSRVDIVSTIRRADDKSTYSQIILENVLVLAADDKMRRDENGKPMPSQVVTLALKPEDAMKVTLSRELGTLSLLLRKINDTTKSDLEKLTAENLKTGDKSRPEEFTESLPPATETKPVPTQLPVVAEKPAPTPTPNPDEKPVQVAEKPVLTRHVMTITEGGRSRFVVFYMNDRGEVVDGDDGDAHPPRPTDGNDPKK